MSDRRFRSLRVRLLLPLVTASLLSALLVAMMSAWLGTQWATYDVDQRFNGIKRTLSSSSFPLTASVLLSLADLTQTELVTFGAQGQFLESTLKLNQDDRAAMQMHWQRTRLQQRQLHSDPINIAHHYYLVYTFDRTEMTTQSHTSERVFAMFDEAQILAARRRAAYLPLVTGMSTIILLGSLSLFLTGRLIGRLQKLQHRVILVAGGDFGATVNDETQDEIGRLASAVDSMAMQLKQLWQTVQRQQSEKLLHQVAGGMAHQLRNTLTGARMALELHARHRLDGNDEEIQVALREVEHAEEYVRRLLLVGVGQQDKDRMVPSSVCLLDVQTSLAPIAKHLKVDIQWDFAESLQGCQVKDGPTLVAAVTNLVMNAIQAGTKVQVEAALVDMYQMRISVSDNGTGITDDIAADIFEPFVTSKPEGLGLGLPLVRRAAEHLDGRIEWSRQADCTVFQFFAKVASGVSG